jgi:hypothetical protein
MLLYVTIYYAVIYVFFKFLVPLSCTTLWFAQFPLVRSPLGLATSTIDIARLSPTATFNSCKRKTYSQS